MIEELRYAENEVRRLDALWRETFDRRKLPRIERELEAAKTRRDALLWRWHEETKTRPYWMWDEVYAAENAEEEAKFPSTRETSVLKRLAENRISPLALC